MIEQITIENFKSFRKVELRLGRLNFFIGTNASGKSNVFDALRVLRGVAGGFPVKELFEGGARTTAGEAWPGIRGGLANAVYKSPQMNRPAPKSDARMRVQFSTGVGEADYQFALDSTGATTGERLAKDGEEVFFFENGDAYFRLPEGGLSPCYPNAFEGSQVILALRTGLAGAHKDFVVAWMKHLLDMQFFELDPEVLRRYGATADIPRMGEHGENFASLVRHVCSDVKSQQAYLTWLRELRPQEVDDVVTLQGAVEEPLFAIKEQGRVFPAPVLSAGTLRFAAVAAAFFQPVLPGMFAFEEIENGVHGSRLRLLVELLRSQTASGQTQVLATTHSPLLLAWLKPEEYETTFLCSRDGITGESRILPLTQIPHFTEVVKRQPIGDLLAEGWMEAVL